MSLAVAPAPAILNASMRCDACSGARAYVVVILKRSRRLPNGGELLLCAHDFRKHEVALIPYVAQLIDERETLTAHIQDDGHVH